MTDEDLKAIETRAAKATPGPWAWRQEPGNESLGTGAHGGEQSLVNPALYAEWSANWEPGGKRIEELCTGIVLRGDGGAGATCGDVNVEDEDATFIAHARQDVPALIAEVRRLRGEALAVRRAVVRRGEPEESEAVPSDDGRSLLELAEELAKDYRELWCAREDRG